MPSPLSIFGKQQDKSAIEFVKNLKAGEHGCMFFTSKEDFRNVQFAFVKSGLENNWGVLYATASEPVDNIRGLMSDYGIDVKKYEKDEQSLIIVRGEDLYKDPKNPDLTAWRNTARSVCDRFIAKNKVGVRVAADLSSYFLSHGLTKQWFELEYALERKFSIPITVICGYDALKLPAAQDLQILDYYRLINKEQKQYVDAHSFAIYANRNKTIVFSI